MAAKEVFVAQMGIVYAVDDNPTESASGSKQLQEKLSRDYSPLVGFCVMLFCLISTPLCGPRLRSPAAKRPRGDGPLPNSPV